MLPNSQAMMRKRARGITLPIKTARYAFVEARAPSSAVAAQVSDALASSTLSWSPTSIPPYLGMADSGTTGVAGFTFLTTVASGD
jgi:hypothetical protein